MTARTLPVAPTFAADSELTSTQLNALVTYQEFWSSPPCFRAEQHTPQSIATSTSTQVTCETTIHDSDSGLSASTPYSYVIPFAGIWDIDGGVSLAGNTTGNRFAVLEQNGVAINGGSPVYAPSSVGALYGTAAPGIACNVGDVISLTMYQTSGSTLSTVASSGSAGQYSWLAGKLVSLQNP